MCKRGRQGELNLHPKATRGKQNRTSPKSGLYPKRCEWLWGKGGECAEAKLWISGSTLSLSGHTLLSPFAPPVVVSAHQTLYEAHSMCVCVCWIERSIIFMFQGVFPTYLSLYCHLLTWARASGMAFDFVLLPQSTVWLLTKPRCLFGTFWVLTGVPGCSANPDAMGTLRLVAAVLSVCDHVLDIGILKWDYSNT